MLFRSGNIKKENSLIFLEQIKALQILAKITNCCIAIISSKTFIEAIADHFIDSNPLVSQVTWNFFRVLTKDTSVLLDILRNKKIANGLSSISNQTNILDNITAIKNLLEFVIMIFKLNTPDFVKEICTIIIPSLGKLTTLYKQKDTMLKSNLGMQTLISQFIEIATKSKLPEASELQTALKKHLVPHGKKTIFNKFYL